jgi:hypothetical protein
MFCGRHGVLQVPIDLEQVEITDTHHSLRFIKGWMDEAVGRIGRVVKGNVRTKANERVYMPST